MSCRHSAGSLVSMSPLNQSPCCTPTSVPYVDREVCGMYLTPSDGLGVEVEEEGTLILAPPIWLAIQKITKGKMEVETPHRSRFSRELLGRSRQIFMNWMQIVGGVRLRRNRGIRLARSFAWIRRTGSTPFSCFGGCPRQILPTFSGVYFEKLGFSR